MLKNKISLVLVASVSCLVFASVLVPQKTQATAIEKENKSITVNSQYFAGAHTNAPLGGDPSGKCKEPVLTASNCGIIYYLLTGINVLSGLVGVVVVVMIAIGGIQYSTARDNPQAVTAAKTRIANAILAFVASLFIYAFLQYIVPGGLLYTAPEGFFR